MISPSIAQLYHVSVRRLAFWLPPIVWMMLILVLSTDFGSATMTRRLLGGPLHWLLPWATPAQIAALHAAIRKIAHLVEYGVLAALWFRALTRERTSPARAGWVTLGVAIACALLDESIQSTTASRTGSPVDVAIDTAGAAATLALVRYDWRRIVDRVTTAALWMAAIGGALALAVNWMAGVPSIALWITTPVAALLLLVRRRRSAASPTGRRRAPDPGGHRPS